VGHEHSLEKIQQALLLHECGRLDEARLIYQEIIRENQVQPVVLNLYGTLLHQQGFHAMAFKMLKKAVAINP
jgi:Tfp pilus assembly protein PilF